VCSPIFQYQHLLPKTVHNMSNVFQRFTGPGRDRTSMMTRRQKLLWSYTPDWILTIFLAAVFFALNSVPGFRRSFSLSDTSLRHPYAVKERVPDLGLYLICFVAPLMLQPVVNLITVRSWWDWHNSTLGLILGLALTGAITQFTKITVGRPRPDIIDRCIPIQGSADPTYGLSTAAICTQTDAAILRDGFRSFPSGHSSLSFAGLGFLSFYLAGKVHLFDRRGHTGKAWLSLTPLAGAALVAISRTMDYRHHWHDVLAGSALGLTLSYFSYRQYYPSLSSEISHLPHAPRIEHEDQGSGTLPMHIHETGALFTDNNLEHVDDVELAETARRNEPALSHVWRDGVHGDDTKQSVLHL